MGGMGLLVQYVMLSSFKAMQATVLSSALLEGRAAGGKFAKDA